jgi:hypothetical protein
MYSTIWAIVRQGKIELLEPMSLPENTTLLVTVLDENLEETSLGEQIIVGLSDMKEGRFKETSESYTVANHLDHVFGPEISPK